jgi:multidrug efflux system membrane fusion protein
MTLPATAVQTDQQGQYVYVIRRDESVEQRRIHVARNTEGLVVVAAGLQADENVVLDGQYGLKPGSRVAIQANAQSVDSRGAAALPGLP